ncbi:hypothetical protein EDD11_006158 [Mortierella claussenii]|nr:hypothetical protein EDD11_006158 [Mortierella claussenii]
MSLARRQRVPLPEPARQIVSRVTGFQPGDEYFDTCTNFVALQLFDVNGLGGVRNKAMDNEAIDSRLSGLTEKFFMHGQDSKGEALKGYLHQLRRIARSLGGGDSARMTAASSEMDRQEAAQNVMSSVLMVLLELSDSPTTLRRGEGAYSIPEALRELNIKPKSQDQINRELWKAILREDPFVGPHWQMQTAGDGLESDGSDFEDMEVNPRAVPTAKDTRSPLQKVVASSDHGMNYGSPQDLWREWPSKAGPSALKTVEKHQYWHHGSVRSKTHTQETGGIDAGFDIQNASSLNLAQRNSAEFILARRDPVMDEVDIIHEVFLMLQGLPTVIFRIGNDGTRYLERICVSHLSAGSLAAILAPFIQGATEIMELQTVVDKICSAPFDLYGKIVQTLASAIHSELVDLKAYLADKQKVYQRYRKGFEQRIASLIELQATLSHKLATVHVLLQFLRERQFYTSSSSNSERACSHSTDILSSLYSNICTLELIGDSEGSSLFLRLFRKSICPFLVNMECWLSGQRLDSEHEFLVQTEFWSEGCYVQAEILDSAIDGQNHKTSTSRISPCFLNDISLNQMVYTGKAIRIVQALLAVETAVVPGAQNFSSTTFNGIFGSHLSVAEDKGLCSSSASYTRYPNYSVILAHQYPLSLEASVSSEHTEPTTFANAQDHISNIDFQWRLDRELAKSIEDQYLCTNALLKSMLFEQSRLLWHLKGMADFYFMMQGEVMHLFSTSIFGKMKRRRPWYDSYILGSTFSQIASLCDWKHAQFVKIKTGVQAGRRMLQTHLSGLKLQVLEQIEFEYLLPWPLTGVIYSTENAKQMYGRITSLLLQVKTAKHAMELPLFLKSEPRRSSELGLFWKLRLRLLTTMNDLWSYLMLTVLDAQIKKFHAEIEGQGDLDDMIRLSRRFIMVCFERCFLKERTAPMHRTLMTMLHLALKFSALFSTFIHEQEAGMYPLDRFEKVTVSRSGRRVSFNAVAHVQSSLSRSFKRRASELHVQHDVSADSEDAEEDEDGDDDEPNEEDIERPIASAVKAKKQKTGGSLGSSRVTWSHPKLTYREQLEAIEQEFNRCREFLAKSLRVVVSSNAARGYANRHRRDGSDEDGAHGEGDSNYLDGLILALSS